LLHQFLLRQTEKDLRSDALKDGVEIIGGRGEHCLSYGFVGIERGTRRIVGDLLEERLADPVIQADRVKSLSPGRRTTLGRPECRDGDTGLLNFVPTPLILFIMTMLRQLY
jgi:hypothetical protein